jgi:prepilin-type N-terminal cleavage/methylation domain-containing protein
MKSISKEKGFTIIEVALVLAIAALIFLVVFLAVPALQRNQRDDARKRDVSNVVAAATTVQGNTGAQPTAGLAYSSTTTDTKTSNLKDYLDTQSNNVDYVTVVAYNSQTLGDSVAATNAGKKDGVNPSLNQIIVFTGAKCGDGTQGTQNTKISAANKRASAVVVQIENGGVGKYYCQDAS